MTEIKEQKCNFVKMKTFLTMFAVIVGVLTTIFSYVFASVGNIRSKVDGYQNDLMEIKAQLSSIQVNLEWIKLKIN